jgi:uncharacterized linocin/CFP29 family protein
VTDHLRREFAPISDAAWEQINNEATRTLTHFLAARAMVEFSGPKGWAHSSEAVGRVRAADSSPGEGVSAGIRESQPLVELRTPFELSISELERVDRGAEDPNLDGLIDAARRAATAEDTLVFDGYAPAGITGIGPASPHEPLTIPDNYNHYPRAVARAVAALRREGVGGPYAIALGPRCYTGVIETTEHGGYPLLEHIKLILGGPVVWAPAVDGAVVISMRGGDYEIVCGQDLSIGYRAHSGDTVELYVEESVTLLINDPRAAVALKYPA